jgi:hypothetical protein
MMRHFPLPARRRAATFALLLGATAVAQAADQVQRADPDTGAETWETQAHGVTLSLTQILPDQARAFYLSRGFDASSADLYATACVYMTVLRNDAAAGEVAYRLADWRLVSAGRETGLRPVDDWLALWRERGLGEPLRIAFRWAQFPPEQEYARGEWNQGMLAVGLPARARFDLVARWTGAGIPYETRLENVHCAR